MKPPKEFLGYLHSFRGFAILNIVFIHAVVAAVIGSNNNEFDLTNPVAIINEVLFHDSTIYFAIISGLLFSAILQKRGYQKFYLSKLRYVVLPYLFITLVVTASKWAGGSISEQNGFMDFLSTLGRDFLFGKANGLYWYIPVLFFLYLVTPLLAYLQRNQNTGKVLTLLIILAPLLVTRVQMAFDYILSLQTMIYFTGAYALGMLMGQNLEQSLERINKYRQPLLIITLVTTLTLLLLYISESDMLGPVSLRESLFYLQKSCLSALLILAFYRLGDRQPQWLHALAKDSFGIYFIHGFVVFGTLSWFTFVLGMKSISPFHTIIGSVLITAFAITISMLVIRLFRLIFKKKSRMFIGS